MAKSYTTDTLIAALKRRSMIPISQATYSDQDLADYLNDEMESTITPMIMDVREEYFVESIDFTVDNNTPAIFDIPTRAVGERLRDVVMVSTEGDQESLTNLPRLSIEQITESQDRGRTSTDLTGFILQGNQVKLYPLVGNGAGTLRLYFYRRPGALVLEANAGLITAINPTTKVVTVDTVLLEWVADYPIATVNQNQPFNYINEDDSIVSINGYNITLADVSDLAVGNYICNVDESVVPQIPIEAHNLLLQAAKIVLLEATDDDKNIKLAQEKYTTMERSFTKTITPRVDGQAKKIVPGNSVFNNTRNWI